ncbi:Gldg family protein [Desulforhopalus singaporensis]|uniref:ABC-2 type transport system permease protein n=1 Tax=Desulforhopalus singaporensis TaxID=91360 RepID=A0A1H0JXW8_9BACT|nr:Gldg family protein [Desulforhopalus singaporensis]SDO48470.1 ABC-2 type transport system permease protein [Desulforhopalus singaporensis]
MNILKRTVAKEFGTFFCSPVAFIFLGSFLAINLFIFFWVETFFARNIDEIRPLFEWMPILLIFLCAATTMRMWSEEHRSGTLEFLLTSPATPFTLVAGKFFACLSLLTIALVLTLPLPITVSFLGQMDWGPVLGGYLATLFLAGAYIAIGLFVSIHSENQIISLITTVVICWLFYLIGSDALIGFFGNRSSEILQLLGSGSRFESITRGVVDFRDLYYYLSITAVFLCLNLYGLEKIRWASNPTSSIHRRLRLCCALIIANLIVANFWLAPITNFRSDITSRKIYSLSDGTRSYLQQLKEPLLIRGYFSPQTHPLLAPLVPRLRDLLKEYAIAGKGKVRVEFVNPIENPEMEREAGQKYGIRPVPFQTSSKYQASVTNSYFDILITYGDQFETLGFRDLIEIKAKDEQDFDVDLRNPEYDITKSIKKVLYSYQGGGDIFTTLSQPVKFIGYFSADKRLPKELAAFKKEIMVLVDDLAKKSDGKLDATIMDPEENGGELADKLESQYGFRPMSASLFDQNTFWFYMTLTSNDQVVEIPLPESFDKESLQRSFMSGLKRFDRGFTKTIAFNTPPSPPPMPQYAMRQPSGPQFNALREILSREHIITEEDLKSGQVAPEADLLLVVAPENLDEKQLFGIDQFLMQGGTVIIATSSFNASFTNKITLAEQSSGLDKWLAHNGVTIGKTMVLDPKNSTFPVPVERDVGGFTVRETHMVNYPYFVDIRPDQMNDNSPIVTGLNQVTMNWPSPITVDEKKNRNRKVTPLLNSSDRSWLSGSNEVQPDFKRYDELGFPVEGQQASHLLGVAIEGSFTSYFAGKPSPLNTATAGGDDGPPPKDGDSNNVQSPEKELIVRQVDKSPGSSRIVIYGSNCFLNDTTLGINSSAMQTGYLEPMQLIANTIDWALEDQGLLDIRGRSHFARPLVPMTRDMQLFWEYLNYALAILGLVLVWIVKTVVKKKSGARQLELLQQLEGRM